MNHRLQWQEGGHEIERPWISESEFSAPKRLVIADDTLKADRFYREASEGAAFLWRGDFQNAKMLLQAVQRRIQRSEKKKSNSEELSAKERFHRYRLMQAHRAQLLSRLLIEVNADLKILLRRAPDVTEAIGQAIGPQTEPFLLSLRELLGFIGAHQWRKKGVAVPLLGTTIHPHYGVFAPVRGEYLDLVMKAPLPKKAESAADVGTGTGVLAAILAKRGFKNIVATDIEPRALASARENLERLQLSDRIQLIESATLPQEKFDLIVCNPPWLPARPTSALERAVFDPEHLMLRQVLSDAPSRLNPGGELWIIISDLAEHLGLREKGQLEVWFRQGQLEVVGKEQVAPTHAKAKDQEDPLYFARTKEVTTLWRLRPIMA